MTTDNPSPDPAAVRAALDRLYDAIEGMASETIACMCVDEKDVATFAAAARAWLEQQEAPCETESR